MPSKTLCIHPVLMVSKASCIHHVLVVSKTLRIHTVPWLFQKQCHQLISPIFVHKMSSLCEALQIIED